MIYTILIITGFTGATIAYSYFYIKKLNKAFDEAEREFDCLSEMYSDLKERHTKAMFDLNAARAGLRGYQLRSKK